MHMDIFNDDAFSAVTMTAALEDFEFTPGLISSLNLFEDVPTSTTSVSVEKRGNTFELIGTSERGEPIDEGTRDGRDLRVFNTTRIAKGHTIQASEIQNVRAFGEESDLETMISYVGRYQQRLLTSVEATWEFQRLGACFGKVLDKDGTVIYDWFREWNITKPVEINFELDKDTTLVELKCRQVIRIMQDKADEAWLPSTTVVGLAGDSFFDKITTHKTTRETYLNQSQATNLNRVFGLAQKDGFRAGSYASFDFGGILFINYKGSKQFDKNAAEGAKNGKEAFGVNSKRCKFIPVGAPGVFQQTFAPGEAWEWANTIGRPLYSLMVRDEKRGFWVRPEVYSYPLFMCTRPEMLLSAKESADA